VRTELGRSHRWVEVDADMVEEAEEEEDNISDKI
jgi:hypothetical protein